MKYFIYLKAFLIFFVLFLLLFPKRAYAYLDPGTGSYFFQLIIAGLLGCLFAIKLFWTEIKTFFKNLSFKKAKHGRDK